MALGSMPHLHRASVHWAKWVATFTLGQHLLGQMSCYIYIGPASIGPDELLHLHWASISWADELLHLHWASISSARRAATFTFASISSTRWTATFTLGQHLLDQMNCFIYIGPAYLGPYELLHLHWASISWAIWASTFTLGQHFVGQMSCYIYIGLASLGPDE